MIVARLLYDLHASGECEPGELFVTLITIANSIKFDRASTYEEDEAVFNQYQKSTPEQAVNAVTAMLPDGLDAEIPKHILQALALKGDQESEQYNHLWNQRN